MSALCQKRTFRHSFDHLVGDGEHVRRNGEAERLGGREVDDELEFGRLQHWQVGGLRALENAAGIDADLTLPMRPQVRWCWQHGQSSTSCRWLAR